MSNIFVSHYKLQEKFKKIIRLIANIYKYKVDNIILPNSSLCMPLKQDVHVQFFQFNFKIILKRKQSFYLMSINFSLWDTF